MIQRDVFCLHCPSQGTFLASYPYTRWVNDIRQAGMFPHPTVQTWREVQKSMIPDDCVMLRYPQCGCCGRIGLVKIVSEGRTQDRNIWRCERHVGRNPCLIDGCGRTFANSCLSGYDEEFICGKHFREAPKKMRAVIARVERDGEKSGWTMQFRRRHDRLWRRIKTAIVEGRRLDKDEISAMFGWE